MDWFEHLAELKRQRVADATWRALPPDSGALVSFATNDYLGLSKHPDVVAAGQKALTAFGAGSTGSPLICGHLAIHTQLEQALARFKGSDAALVFPSGFQAALATLNALSDERTTIILDRLSHASLLDGARQSPGRWRTFIHNDLADLATILNAERKHRCLVVVEALYSMDGDTAPIADLVNLTREAGALLLVDEAHSTGVLGPSGRGMLETVLVDGKLPRHVIAMGTLSKALGAQGGFICACQEIVEMIVFGRAYMFSTALAPAAAGAALAALKLCETDSAPRQRVLMLAERFRRELRALGLCTSSTEGAIVPVLIGDANDALACSERLRERGLRVPAIRYPTVKKGEARLRVSFSAAHTDEEVEQLIAGIKEPR